MVSRGARLAIRSSIPTFLSSIKYLCYIRYSENGGVRKDGWMEIEGYVDLMWIKGELDVEFTRI